MNQPRIITKATGEQVPFSEEKYRQSLERAGATPELIDAVYKEVAPAMREGMTTHELYKITHQLLSKKQQRSVAGRYNFRQAIMALGPSGYPFERYIAELLKQQGYQVEVDQEIPGKCVSHETDVVASKGNECFVIECKFHEEPSSRCAIQTALYIKARYDDIVARHGAQKYTGTWLVTNAKISVVAIQYGECIGMKLLAWAYPAGNSLEKMVDKQGLHPITCLSSLPKDALEILLHEGVVLCANLHQHKDLLQQARLSNEAIDDILRECDEICRTKR
jgi:hypothetical protein